MGLWKLRLSMLGTLALIIGISTLLFTVVLSYIGTLSLFSLATFVVGFNLLQWLIAPYIIDMMYGVREAPRESYPQLYRMVEEISSRAGVRTPRVMIARLPVPNAFAYGSPIAGTRVAVTEALLSTLEEEEVEAVIGHELGHIKHRDMQVMMFASVLPAIFYYIGYSLMLSSWYRGGREEEQGPSAALLGFLFMAVYWVLTMLVLHLSRLREYYADRFSAENVYDGARKLMEALAKIVAFTGRLRSNLASEGARVGSFKALFISDPDTADRDLTYLRGYMRDQELVKQIMSRGITTAERIAELFSTHPNIVKRLRALQEIAGIAYV